MPRCFLAKKSSSLTSSLTSSSSSSSCNISSPSSAEIEEGNNHLDDHLTPLTEKWDDAIIVKSEIETEDEEGISSDGNCSNNSGEDHFIPPSRLIHRSTVGSISAAHAVQSIRQPLDVATPCTSGSSTVNSSSTIYHPNYDENGKIYISSKNDDDAQQSSITDSIDNNAKRPQTTTALPTNTSTSVNTIATQTYGNPEDDSEEEDTKPNPTVLNRKQRSISSDDQSKLNNEALSSSTTPNNLLTSNKCDVSTPKYCNDFNIKTNITPAHSNKSKDFNGNDDSSKPTYLEQKERLEKNLINQTLKFCSRKHSKKHQKRKKKLLSSKIAIDLKLNAKDVICDDSSSENKRSIEEGKQAFDNAIKLNDSYATTVSIVNPMPPLTSNLHSLNTAGSFPIKSAPTKATSQGGVNSNFKLLPQQPVSIAAVSQSMFQVSSPVSKAITGLSYPATAVTAGGATIHPIQPTGDSKGALKLSSNFETPQTDASRITSCNSQGKYL